MSEDIDCCPICAEPLRPDDMCATDIDLGPCHAACLAGSPVVDFDTGAEIPEGQVATFRYGGLDAIARAAAEKEAE